MPSTAVLEMKKQQVAALSDRIKNSCAGVVVDYKGITVSDDTQLRHELREAGVHYTVVKNTLLGRAAEPVWKALSLCWKAPPPSPPVTMTMWHLPAFCKSLQTATTILPLSPVIWTAK